MDGTQPQNAPDTSPQRETAQYTATPPPPGPPAAVPPPGWMPTSKDVFDPRRKSPAVACLLSLMPGLGQIYVGYYVRGFVNLLVVAGAIALVATGDMGELTPMFGMFIPFFWLYNIIDAGRRASLFNHALLGTDAVDLPEDFRLPSTGGAIFGGVLIVVMSLAVLSHTAMGYSLAWLEDWWPTIPLAFGVYLLARGIADSMKRKSEKETKDREARGV